jgi:Ser/Thr protein kinase RdoA (MazF antagonist)
MPLTPSSVGKTGGQANPPVFSSLLALFYIIAGIERLLKGYSLMSKILSRENARLEMLLALAGYWRNCAAQSNEPWRSDVMRGTAEEFEKAAARTTSQTLTIMSS